MSERIHHEPTDQVDWSRYDRGEISALEAEIASRPYTPESPTIEKPPQVTTHTIGKIASNTPRLGDRQWQRPRKGFSHRELRIADTTPESEAQRPRF